MIPTITLTVLCVIAPSLAAFQADSGGARFPHHNHRLAHMGKMAHRTISRAIVLSWETFAFRHPTHRRGWLCCMRAAGIKESGARTPNLANCVLDSYRYGKQAARSLRFVQVDLGAENAD